MGGRRLTPREAVDALGEAIDVIRALWDVDAPGGVRIEGEHYKVKGAKRGPAPAHDVSIWVGAYKPRMLGLTGRKADGWLPSLPYLPRDAIAQSNRLIDEAAEEAGRDPRDVRRLLNAVPVEESPLEQVEALLPLVLEHGFSTFVVPGDDAAVIERFGREFAPALREAVARERGATPSRTR